MNLITVVNLVESRDNSKLKETYKCHLSAAVNVLTVPTVFRCVASSNESRHLNQDQLLAKN